MRETRGPQAPGPLIGVGSPQKPAPGMPDTTGVSEFTFNVFDVIDGL